MSYCEQIQLCRSRREERSWRGGGRRCWNRKILLREGPMEEMKMGSGRRLRGERPASSMGSGRLRWRRRTNPLVGAVRPRRSEEKITPPAETQGGASGSNPPQPYLTRRVSGGSVGLSPSNTGPPNGLVRVWGGFTLGRANTRRTQIKHCYRTRPNSIVSILEFTTPIMERYSLGPLSIIHKSIDKVKRVKRACQGMSVS
jgi:hypothetical protein